jgi:hypothetical protein
MSPVSMSWRAWRAPQNRAQQLTNTNRRPIDTKISGRSRALPMELRELPSRVNITTGAQVMAKAVPERSVRRFHSCNRSVAFCFSSASSVSLMGSLMVSRRIGTSNNGVGRVSFLPQPPAKILQLFQEPSNRLVRRTERLFEGVAGLWAALVSGFWTRGDFGSVVAGLIDYGAGRALLLEFAPVVVGMEDGV